MQFNQIAAFLRIRERGCKTTLQAEDPPASYSAKKYEKGLNKREIISTRYQSGFESRPPANSPHYRHSGKRGRPDCILGQYSGFGIIYIFRHAWLTISLLRTNFGGLQSRWPWRHYRRGNICNETLGSIQMFIYKKMAGGKYLYLIIRISEEGTDSRACRQNLNINLTPTSFDGDADAFAKR